MMNLFKNNKVAAFLCVLSGAVLSACSNLPASTSGTSNSPAQVTPSNPASDCQSKQEGVQAGHCELAGIDPEPESNDIWRRLPKGYQLQEHGNNQRVKSLLDWYTTHPKYLKQVSERAHPYLAYIAENIEQRGMPAELLLLPAVESTYDPFAYSPGRASGLWQFVPITARHVGLRQTWWYDGRRDIIASTDAALDYLEDLNKRFDGDWLLTLAAYNSGATTVKRAIARNQRQGKPTDYWSLKLPYETRRYVPKLLALSQLVATADQYNLDLPAIPTEQYFKAVDIGGQLDLAQAADLAGISIDEMYRLNPGFNRWATDPGGPHRLLIPSDKADNFQNRLAAIPDDQRINWQRYTVQPGDSLIKIARESHTDIATIKASNKLKNNIIRAGQVLLLPSASRGSQHYRLSVDQRLAKAQASGGRGEKVQIFHEVEFGDSLWTLARRYQVSVSNLSKWNNIAPRDTIRPGQKLAVWTNPQTATKAPGTSPYEIIRKIGYTVRSGDSLSRIASRFNVNIRDIVKWNTINPGKFIRPGQRLTLFVDITQTSLP